MNIFIICTVRGATDEYKEMLETHVEELEKSGHNVHLPHRDTNQDAKGFDICKQNSEAIMRADVVHIFYSSASQGTHFDLGVAFAFNKDISVVNPSEYGPGKSFPRMLAEWEDKNYV